MKKFHYLHRLLAKLSAIALFFFYAFGSTSVATAFRPQQTVGRIWDLVARRQATLQNGQTSQTKNFATEEAMVRSFLQTLADSSAKVQSSVRVDEIFTTLVANEP